MSYDGGAKSRQTIWTITALWFLADPRRQTIAHLGCRTFGFYPSKQAALMAIRRDPACTHECLYSHLVVEEFGPSIHAHARSELWFKWDAPARWRRCKKPEPLMAIVNWGMG